MSRTFGFLKIFVKRMLSSIYQLDPREVGPFGVERLPYPVKWEKFFDHESISLEIGCGHGELLEYLASSRSNELIIGFEIVSEYTRKSARRIADLPNVLIFKADAYPLIDRLFGKATISNLYILFPDPWHKKKHHKRRPIRKEWLTLIWPKLRSNGMIYFATDWDEYYEFVFNEMSEFERSAVDAKVSHGIYDPLDAGLVETHYYRKWREMGRKFKFIKLEKIH